MHNNNIGDVLLFLVWLGTELKLQLTKLNSTRRKYN